MSVVDHDGGDDGPHADAIALGAAPRLARTFRSWLIDVTGYTRPADEV